MAKLMDIEGWDVYYASGLNRYLWKGKILLDDNGWFEGIVVNPNKDIFVFGVYHPEKLIELCKLTPNNDNKPLVFHGKRDARVHGKRDAKDYTGTIEIIGLSLSIPCGVFCMNTQYAEAVRENTEAETSELKTRIQRYKQTIMDEEKNIMYQIILRIYKEREFTPEESQQIEEEFQPVNDRFTAAIQEAKKHVKTIPRYLSENDD